MYEIEKSLCVTSFSSMEVYRRVNGFEISYSTLFLELVSHTCNITIGRKCSKFKCVSKRYDNSSGHPCRTADNNFQLGDNGKGLLFTLELYVFEALGHWPLLQKIRKIFCGKASLEFPTNIPQAFLTMYARVLDMLQTCSMD